jgi:hypothetical protein
VRADPAAGRQQPAGAHGGEGDRAARADPDGRPVEALRRLLDAIARSDGTRASVTRELLATRIEDGLVGPVRFDADGDVRPSPFAIIRPSRSTRTVNGIEPDGSNILDVVAPR